MAGGARGASDGVAPAVSDICRARMAGATAAVSDSEIVPEPTLQPTSFRITRQNSRGHATAD